jgi:hypothetical protein
MAAFRRAGARAFEYIAGLRLMHTASIALC